VWRASTIRAQELPVRIVELLGNQRVKFLGKDAQTDVATQSATEHVPTSQHCGDLDETRVHHHASVKLPGVHDVAELRSEWPASLVLEILKRRREVLSPQPINDFVIANNQTHGRPVLLFGPL
jgi:hypothetical protein